MNDAEFELFMKDEHFMSDKEFDITEFDAENYNGEVIRLMKKCCIIYKNINFGEVNIPEKIIIDENADMNFKYKNGGTFLGQICTYSDNVGNNRIKELLLS